MPLPPIVFFSTTPKQSRFRFNLNKQQMNDYTIEKAIGDGSYGSVFLAIHKEEKTHYVIKKLQMWNLKQEQRQKIDNEVKLLREFQHINIVGYRDSFIDKEGYLNIVMINCEGGDMFKFIEHALGKKFDERQIIDWAVQVALAIYYMHQKKILHRDLKTSNIFLNQNRVRLGDFGISKVLEQSSNELAKTNIGTPLYMSPEQFKNKPYSYKSDIWAFGCVLYQMCNQKHAFNGNSLQGLARKIFLGEFAPVSEHYSHGLRELIHKMLSQNPKGRPTIIEILQKPFMKRRVQSYIKEIIKEGNCDQDFLGNLLQQGKSLGIHVQRMGPESTPKRSASRNSRLESEEKLKRDRERVREELRGKLLKESEEKKKMQLKIKEIERQRKEMSSAAKNKRKNSYGHQKGSSSTRTPSTSIAMSQKRDSSTNLQSSVSSRGFKKEDPQNRYSSVTNQEKPAAKKEEQKPKNYPGAVQVKKPFQMKEQHDMHYEEDSEDSGDDVLINAIIKEEIDDVEQDPTQKIVSEPNQLIKEPIEKEEIIAIKREKTVPSKIEVIHRQPYVVDQAKRQEVQQLKRVVKEKTAMINMMETELQAIDFQFSSDSDNEKISPQKKKENPTYIRLRERANDLKHKIISKLGRQGYNKFMKYAHSHAGKENKPSRKEVSGIVGEQLVGLWHLAQQIVSLDKIAEGIPQFF